MGFGDRRGGDDRDYGRGESNSCDMYVEAKECGRIIGRQGSKIRDLQDETGCKIRVSRDDEGDGTRRVELQGSDDQIEWARQRINEILQEPSRDGFGGGQGGARGGGGFGGGQGGSKETISIDSSFVGRIIGKGGSRIRELQDQTGCRINVSRDGNGQTTDVELVGSSSQIRNAKDAIDDITSNVY